MVKDITLYKKLVFLVIEVTEGICKLFNHLDPFSSRGFERITEIPVCHTCLHWRQGKIDIQDSFKLTTFGQTSN